MGQTRSPGYFAPFCFVLGVRLICKENDFIVDVIKTVCTKIRLDPETKGSLSMAYVVTNEERCLLIGDKIRGEMSTEQLDFDTFRNELFLFAIKQNFNLR